MSNYLYWIYTLPFLLFLLLFIFKFKEKQIRFLSLIALIPPNILNFLVGYEFIKNSSFFYNIKNEILSLLSLNENHTLPIIKDYIGLDLFELHLGSHHHFGFSLFIDELSLIVLFLTSFLSLLVARLSHIYLHREPGYQRFYRTMFLFVTGMYLIALAGSLDMFFAGWELVGFSSFLLIAFYRNRTRPVKNAFRVYSVYRLADIGLLLSAIAGHVISKNADHFEVLASGQSFFENVNGANWGLFLGLFILLAAIGKSGQFPFINWPARAMEGPTPSSAIFYGALSIHCGVILLLRTYGIWKDSTPIIALICLVGFLSIVFASGIGRVQSNIKGRIAYAIVAQIGVMFIEVALGFHQLVMFHIVAHSLLRCYQLLISPSVIVENIKTLNRDISKKSRFSIESYLPIKIKTTLYSFVFQETFLSTSERGILFFSLIQWKLFFRKLMLSPWTPIIVLSILVLPTCLMGPIETTRLFAYLFAGLDILISIQCLLSLEHPRRIWRRFLGAQFAFLISIYLVNPNSLIGIWLYMLSVVPCWYLGYLALRKIGKPNMKIYNGFYVTSPRRANLMFMAFIGFSGLPLTTVFWAEDILLGEIFLLEPTILILTTLSLMFNGLVVARILVKTFWGFPTYVKI